MNIEEILKKHINEEGKFDQAAAAKELKEAQGKEFVPKAEFNSKNEELKSANSTLDTLKKENKDVEDLQKTITDYKSKMETLEAERVEERKTFALKEALKEAGAKDVDYMMYKLGEVELDKEGNVIELENKIKTLKESSPTHFNTDGEQNKEGNADNNKSGGYEVFDNALDGGKATDAQPVTLADAIKSQYENN